MSANYFTLISVLLVWLLVIFGFWKFQRKNLAKVSLIALGLLVFQGTVGYFEWLLPTGTFPTFYSFPFLLLLAWWYFRNLNFAGEMVEEFPFGFLLAFNLSEFFQKPCFILAIPRGLPQFR